MFVSFSPPGVDEALGPVGCVDADPVRPPGFCGAVLQLHVEEGTQVHGHAALHPDELAYVYIYIYIHIHMYT